MLEIIDNLKPFFEDCYRRISVREYSRIIKKSPPTSSKLLDKFSKEDLLKKENTLNYIFYHANIESKEFLELSKIYWNYKLKELTTYLEKILFEPTIILFGSLSKAETKEDSDIDLAIISIKKELNLKKFEKKIKRNMQVFWFNSLGNIKNKELANNIINGFKLKGDFKL
jgi:predicted nucleotidyltransferase